MRIYEMKKHPVKSHTFNGRKYKVELTERIDGVTDVPGTPDPYEILILDGNDLKALHSALHEGLEAIGASDIHDYRDDGYPKTWDVAKFLWRLGYRRR